MPPGEDDQDGTGADDITDDGAGDSGQQDDFDKNRAMATIKALRDSEKNLKKQYGETSKRLKELEDASKSETDKMTAELERLRKLEQDYTRERKVQVARTAFAVEAQKANALKPDALFKLAEGLEFDDDGKPTNAAAVIKTLRSEYPELFNTGSANGGSGRDKGVEPPSMNEMIRSRMGR